MYSSNKKSFYFAVFDYSFIGQMVVKDDTSLKSVNKRMFQYFNMDPQAVDGVKFGNLFRCDAVEGSELICGNSPTCKNCDIRKSLINILNNNAEIENVCIKFDYLLDKNQKDKWFDVSGRQMLYMGEKYAVLSFSDVTKHKHSKMILESQLKLDLTTGAINKYSLIEMIDELIKKKVDESFFTICMVDFDFFKEINDKHGHLMGDSILKEFSRIAQSNIRSGDILGRYGGEEFIIIFKQTKQEQALRILERIHKELSAYFSTLMPAPVNFSAGLLHINNEKNPFSGSTQLIESVDKLLYKAKKSGRNRVVFNEGVYLFSQQE